MDLSQSRSLFRELSDSVILLVMTGVSLGGYVGLALILVRAVR